MAAQKLQERSRFRNAAHVLGSAGLLPDGTGLRLTPRACQHVAAYDPRVLMPAHERYVRDLDSRGAWVSSNSDDVEEDRESDERDLVDGQLPMTARQEHFSLAFTRMVAYVAGCAVKSHDTDYEGVDITLTSSADYRRYWGAEFDLQLKCTTQHRYLNDTHMTWPMHTKPYRKLIQPRRYQRVYLGVLLLPEDADKWLSVDENRLITESRMYWQAASEFAPDNGTQKTKTVHLPRANLFAGEQLLGIMKSIGDDEGGTR
ncbi:DUF4365 domain-containing protein [Streptomyces castrisilvae]|uniref:DUF4365 domain-containing protein n=1 Tax=Streptomyces castrisilvae TaxID=3033811 RepID=A0ABY9HKJ9_9ACTN|nr:DUF4365 domain-containing protein [Streptomyces sp. Mut1]WLQ34664.1 DUF4365 domain-containing protein [Streptomyces sp. Mut1]